MELELQALPLPLAMVNGKPSFMGQAFLNFLEDPGSVAFLTLDPEWKITAPG
jgi:hypothetical protein